MTLLLLNLLFLILTPMSLPKLIRLEFSETLPIQPLPFLRSLIFVFFFLGTLLSKEVFSPVIVVLLYGNLLLAYTDIHYTLLSPTVLYGQFILMLGVTLSSPVATSFFWWAPVFFYLSFRLLAFIVPNGFGQGDIKLLCIWSCFVDFISVWQILFIATISALIYVLLLMVFEKEAAALPFVPFLYIGLVCVVVL